MSPLGVTLFLPGSLTTIAEGVETEGELRELTALDCDLAQGYLWSRPVEAEEVADVMANIGKVTDNGLIQGPMAPTGVRRSA